MNYERIKKNYDTQLWDRTMVHDAYKGGIINIVQYYMITGTVEDEDVPDGMTKEEFIEYLDSLINK